MNNNLENTFYDIIVIGCGLSGICLVLELCKRTKKKILILEKKKKLINDKNWCFWNHPLNDVKFSYNNIPSIKLYGKIIEKVKDHSNLDILFNQDITELIEDKDLVQIESNKRRYKSKVVFDSRPPKLKSDGLIQHFLGVEYLFDEKVFNKKEVTLMDFQKNENVIHFFYILPFTEKKALIETTYFSKKTYNKEKYIEDINRYVKKKFPNKKFRKIGMEQGIIPMHPINNYKNSNRIISIGTANNWIRRSSGYGFQNAFINSEIIVSQIIKQEPIEIIQKPLTRFLDSIFCQLLEKNPRESVRVFISFFSNLELRTIIKFLTNTNSFLDTLKVLWVLPKVKLMYYALITIIKNDK